MLYHVGSCWLLLGLVSLSCEGTLGEWVGGREAQELNGSAGEHPGAVGVGDIGQGGDQLAGAGFAQWKWIVAAQRDALRADEAYEQAQGVGFVDE